MAKIVTFANHSLGDTFVECYPNVFQDEFLDAYLEGAFRKRFEALADKLAAYEHTKLNAFRISSTADSILKDILADKGIALNMAGAADTVPEAMVIRLSDTHLQVEFATRTVASKQHKKWFTGGEYGVPNQ